jgi:hypothetical protein
MSNTTKEGVNVCSGQIWKDLDKRNNRFVKVLSVQNGKATVLSCNERFEVLAQSKRTKISITRMHKHATGYALVQDVER